MLRRRTTLWLTSGVLCIGTALAVGACSSTTDDPGASVPAPSPSEGGAPQRAKRELCVDGKSVDGAYPKADYAFGIGRTLPELTFETEAAPLTLREYFEPCAAPMASRLLVLRVTAAWCGTCRWHAEHTKAIASLDVAPRLQLVDLLVGDEDNLPPRPSDIALWQARLGVPMKVALDPEARLMPVNPVAAPLPLYVLVDTKRMEVVNLLNDPEPNSSSCEFDRSSRRSMPRPRSPAPERRRSTESSFGTSGSCFSR